jgi:hypothetical protein
MHTRFLYEVISDALQLPRHFSAFPGFKDVFETIKLIAFHVRWNRESMDDLRRRVEALEVRVLMPERYEAFKEEVNAKLGGLPPAEFVKANPGQHVWGAWGEYESCAFCGVIKRPDGKNGKCRGIVKIGLR